MLSRRRERARLMNAPPLPAVRGAVGGTRSTRLDRRGPPLYAAPDRAAPRGARRDQTFCPRAPSAQTTGVHGEILKRLRHFAEHRAVRKRRCHVSEPAPRFALPRGRLPCACAREGASGRAAALPHPHLAWWPGAPDARNTAETLASTQGGLRVEPQRCRRASRARATDLRPSRASLPHRVGAVADRLCRPPGMRAARSCERLSGVGARASLRWASGFP